MLGLLTRLAAIPLIIDMLVAILSTKIPILLGQRKNKPRMLLARGRGSGHP
jgi:uncharacterized membrane protein YphA (DoxX/SURF4 family)